MHEVEGRAAEVPGVVGAVRDGEAREAAVAEERDGVPDRVDTIGSRAELFGDMGKDRAARVAGEGREAGGGAASAAGEELVPGPCR